MDRNALAAEYLSWTKKYGNGRNEHDLRFGQYVCTFNVAGFGDVAHRFFNEENATIAFMRMVESLDETP